MSSGCDSADPNLFRSAKPLQFVFLVALVVRKGHLDSTGVRDAGSTSWGVNGCQRTRALTDQEMSYSGTLSWGSSHPG